MDRNKIARLLRELADELESDESPKGDPVIPLRPLSDIDRMKARKAMRRKGVAV